MSIANDGENLMLNWAFTDASVTRPTAWYVALHDGDPSETGANNEVTTSEDADYVRKSATFADAVNGVVSSESGVSWTVASTSSGYTITHVSVWTAATSGTCLAYGALYSPHALAADNVVTFNAGALNITLD